MYSEAGRQVRRSGIFVFKKRRLKFLIFTIIPTFAFPKKTVYQCDAEFWDELLAGVAQLVEQLICNQQVGGSNPFSGSEVEV